jgi:hypothetical protein
VKSESHINKKNLCKPIYDKIESYLHTIRNFWEAKTKNTESTNNTESTKNIHKTKKTESLHLFDNLNECTAVCVSHIHTTSKSKILEEDFRVLKNTMVSSEPYNIEEESKKLKESFGVEKEITNMLQKKRERKSDIKEISKDEENNLCEKILTNSSVSLSVTGSDLSQFGKSKIIDSKKETKSRKIPIGSKLTRSGINKIDEDLKVFIQYCSKEIPFLKKFKLNK